MKLSQIVIEMIYNLKKKNVMPLKMKVSILRKMMILKIVNKMRELMMEMLMPWKSFMKHGVVVLCPLSEIVGKQFKVGLAPSKIIFFICFNDTPLKMMKNAFYFILRALFVLKIFKFLFQLFGHRKNSLIWRPGYCSISHDLKATRQ